MREPSPTTDARSYSLLACVLCSATIITSFAICTFNPNAARDATQLFDVRENESAERQSGVTSKSVIGYVLLGGSGVLALLLAPRPRGLCLPVLLTVAAYFAFLYGSILWSDEPGLTIRKLGVATFCFLASFGYSRLLGLRGLAAMCAMTAAAGALLGLLAELRLGAFRPWQPGYTFVGLLDKNGQALWISLFLLPTLFIWAQGKRQFAAVVAVVIAAGLLILTNSRAALASCVVAASTGVFLHARSTTKLLLATTATLGVGIVVCLAAIVGVDDVAQVAALGRTEHVGKLTGRLPLWGYVFGDIFDRPFLGHGYSAYWTSDKIEEVSSTFFWQAHQAHSVYVDLLLGMGLFGLIFFVAALATGLVTAVNRYRVTDDPTYLFVASVVVLALVNGFAESKFFGVGLSGMMLFACLFALAFEPAPAAAAERSASKFDDGPRLANQPAWAAVGAAASSRVSAGRPSAPGVSGR